MKYKVCVKFLLCSLILSVALSACTIQSADSYHPNDSYTDKVETKAGTFSGTFKIKTEASESLTLDPDSSVSSVRSDAMRARYEQIEELFDCTVEAQQVKDGSITSTMMASTAAARTYADIFQLSAENIYNMYKGGYLTYAQNLEDFDITDEKWGFDGQKEMMTFSEGQTYGFRNLYWAAPLPSISGVVYYNENILASNVMPSPAELYENDQWDWEHFEEICIGVTHHIADRQGTYAFVTPTSDYPDIIHAAIHSNGGTRLTYDETLGYQCGYVDMKTIDALDWLGDLIRDNKITYNISGSNSAAPEVEAFVNSYTAFLVSSSSVGFSDDEYYPMYSLEDGFRWIEFPKGPSFDGETTAYYSGNDQFLALSNTVDIGIVGQILNAMFEPLDEEDETGWKTYIERNFFFYDEDFTIYEKMLRYAKTDYSVLTVNTNLSINDIFAAVIDGVKTPKEATEQLVPVVEGLLG